MIRETFVEIDYFDTTYLVYDYISNDVNDCIYVMLININCDVVDAQEYHVPLAIIIILIVPAVIVVVIVYYKYFHKKEHIPGKTMYILVFDKKYYYNVLKFSYFYIYLKI